LVYQSAARMIQFLNRRALKRDGYYRHIVVYAVESYNFKVMQNISQHFPSLRMERRTGTFRFAIPYLSAFDGTKRNKEVIGEKLNVANQLLFFQRGNANSCRAHSRGLICQSFGK